MGTVRHRAEALEDAGIEEPVVAEEPVDGAPAVEEQAGGPGEDELRDVAVEAVRGLFTGREPSSRYIDLAMSRHVDQVRAAGGPVEPDEWTRHFVALGLADG